MNATELKRIVTEKYGQIARQSGKKDEASCSCQPAGCCSSVDYSVFSESYENLDGYNPDADLELGCGIPTAFAGIKTGDSVLDLGSGAGNDCFVARALVGDSGKVTGLDFTDEMLHKAARNLHKLGYQNVTFIKGDIENMPLPDNEFDVILSNCVLNLVPDKDKAFSEMFRVLKPGGNFCVSDVVVKGILPEKLRKDAEFYAGCVSGAAEMDEYIKTIERNGFTDIQVHKQKKISLPDDLLKDHFATNEILALKSGETGIFSITVSGFKSQVGC